MKAELVEFVVRYVSGERDTVIKLSSNDPQLKNYSSNAIRRQIRVEYPSFSCKRLKLLHNGRVLLSHTNFSKEVAYLQDAKQNQDESQPQSESPQPQLPADSPIRLYFHCIIGEDLSAEELAQEESLDYQPQKSTTEAPRGFDRLLSQGFSAAEIDDLRRQFMQIHGSRLPENSHGDQLRDLEDRWIDSTVLNEIDEFPANLDMRNGNGNGESAGLDSFPSGADARNRAILREERTQRDMLVGVCVGFALGGFALLLLWMNVGGVFNKKTKMAIISGVIVNFSFGLLKNWS